MIYINIGIDIDGVINNLSLFHMSCGSKFCFDHNLSCKIDTGGYDSTDIFNWGITIDGDFWEEYYLKLLLETDYVRPYAVEVINKLKENHKIFIISSRKNSDLPLNAHDNMYNITKKYLNKMHLTYDTLILTNKPKHHELIKNHIDTMIEDNPIFFKESAPVLNIPLLCFDAPYNKECSANNIIRVYSWYDVLKTIEEVVL